MISSIHVNLNLKIRHSPIYLPHTWIVISVLTKESLILGFMTREMTTFLGKSFSFVYCACLAWAFVNL